MLKIILGLFIIIVAALFVQNNIEGFETIQFISDGWYINLDRSTDRMKKIQAELHKLSPLKITRWPAVDGSKFTDEDYERLDIPHWSRPSFAVEHRQKPRKAEIGCYLSHYNLLKHLNTLNTDPQMGHLILEDDIVVSDDCVKTWNNSVKTIPQDWDMIFLGLLDVGNFEILDVSNGIGRPTWVEGAHAYVVKHSSLPKLIDMLKVFSEPIDEVYGRNVKNLKVYALKPYKINQGGVVPSTIQI
jgi:GR25 family glycosyltransferase involved in LPS biosynthesis